MSRESERRRKEKKSSERNDKRDMAPDSCISAPSVSVVVIQYISTLNARRDISGESGPHEGSIPLPFYATRFLRVPASVDVSEGTFEIEQ